MKVRQFYQAILRSITFFQKHPMILTKANKTKQIRLLLVVAVCLASNLHMEFSKAQSREIVSNPTPGHRQIPEKAVLGKAQMQQQNVVLINGRSWMMSPGASVRDERNMLTNITALYQMKLIRFTSNPQGMVDKIWILDHMESSDKSLDANGVNRPGIIKEKINELIDLVF